MNYVCVCVVNVVSFCQKNNYYQTRWRRKLQRVESFTYPNRVGNISNHLSLRMEAQRHERNVFSFSEHSDIRQTIQHKIYERKK